MVCQENATDSPTYMLRLTRRTTPHMLAHSMHVPAQVSSGVQVIFQHSPCPICVGRSCGMSGVDVALVSRVDVVEPRLLLEVRSMKPASLPADDAAEREQASSQSTPRSCTVRTSCSMSVCACARTSYFAHGADMQLPNRAKVAHECQRLGQRLKCVAT